MNKIVEVIKKSSSIAVTFHQSPDGDSLGSATALIFALRKLNKDAYIISKEAFPEVFSYLPNISEVDGNCTNIKENTELLITLDCGDIKRLNANLNFEGKKYIVVNIDHHISNEKFGDINYIDTKAAAVGEIIYDLIQSLGVEIDKYISTGIYTSLLTDTGSFRHSNTTAKTHEVAASLNKTGFDFSSIHRNIFDNKKFNIIKLQGLVINNMYLTANKKICVMKITEEMLKSTQLVEVDSAEFVSLGLKIDTVEVAVLLKEREDIVKVSLRSKDYVNVNKIATAFGGGGHIKASGITMNNTLEEAEQILINEIEKELI
jgi:phosphoesterase RecJ-like protein